MLGPRWTPAGCLDVGDPQCMLLQLSFLERHFVLYNCTLCGSEAPTARVCCLGQAPFYLLSSIRPSPVQTGEGYVGSSAHLQIKKR